MSARAANLISTQNVIPAPVTYTPLGYAQAVLGVGVVNLPSIPANATMALISCTSVTVRWRDDGTDPDATHGMPLLAGQEFQYSGNLGAIRFIGNGATLDVSYYA